MSATSRPKRRVAVTGLSALCPAGVGLEACRRWLEAPQGTHVPDFRAGDYIRNPKLLRSMHRSFELVAAAAVLAMRQARLPDAASLPASGFAPERAGLAAALPDLSPLTPDLIDIVRQSPPRAGGGLDWARFADTALHQLHPFRRLTLLANMATAHTSLLFDLQGPSFTFTSGPAGGAQVISEAYWTVADGAADMMVGQSAASPEQSFAASPEPELAAGIVLEDWDAAKRRGIAILAEIVEGKPAQSGPRQASSAASPVPAMLTGLLRLDEAQGKALTLNEVCATRAPSSAEARIQ